MAIARGRRDRFSEGGVPHRRAAGCGGGGRSRGILYFATLRATRAMPRSCARRSRRGSHMNPTLRMKVRHIAFAALSCAILTIVWIRLAPGSDQQAPAVRPEDRVCNQDADCKLVEVPCTCGQLRLAVNVHNYKKYERHTVCSSSEISHCATAGASVPQAAVCRVGLCTAVIPVPTWP